MQKRFVLKKFWHPKNLEILFFSQKIPSNCSQDITVSGAVSVIFSGNIVGLAFPSALRINNAKSVSIDSNLFELNLKGCTRNKLITAGFCEFHLQSCSLTIVQLHGL